MLATRYAPARRPGLAVLFTLAMLVALPACAPASDDRKTEPHDASTEPPVDAGTPLEQFCGAADGGCDCFANTCDRVCGPGECQDLEIVCPRGQDCLIHCSGPGACDGLRLECETGDADCALDCSDGACARARMRCNDVIGNNCCLCIDESDAFECPFATGPTSCDAPPPAE